MMKRLIACLVLLFPLWAGANDATYGVHGMALFGGRDGLYASHLPMFHAPHDKQVVLRVRFKDARLDREMRERLDGKTALWTLDPQRFALGRLAPDAPLPLREFTANVVEGHFEQGGAVRQHEAAMVVEQVLLYRPLSADLRSQPVSVYVPIGRFLVKLVDSRPDFDHIVLLRRAVKEQVTVPKRGVAENRRELAQRAPVAGTVYYYTDDLR